MDFSTLDVSGFVTSITTTITTLIPVLLPILAVTIGFRWVVRLIRSFAK